MVILLQELLHLRHLMEVLDGADDADSALELRQRFRNDGQHVEIGFCVDMEDVHKIDKKAKYLNSMLTDSPYGSTGRNADIGYVGGETLAHFEVNVLAIC